MQERLLRAVVGWALGKCWRRQEKAGMMMGLDGRLSEGWA